MKYTDFRQYSHAELRAMVQALNPGEVMAAADPWRRAADTLKAIRSTLTRASTEAATAWEGSTSDAFHTRMLHLATTINTAASYANDAAITLKAVSEAIAKAKRDMPEEPSGWAQFKDGVGDTFSSLFGADDEDARTDLANQKKAEAATVLQTLAMHYRTAAPMLKPPPPPGPPPKLKQDVQDVPDPSGSDGPATVGAMMAGASFGSPTAGGGVDRAVASGPGVAGRSVDPSSKRPASGERPHAVAPTDSGIKGGTPQAAPKPPAVTNVGPGVSSKDTGAVPLQANRPATAFLGPGVGIDGGTLPLTAPPNVPTGSPTPGPGSSTSSLPTGAPQGAAPPNGFTKPVVPGRGSKGGLVFEGDGAAAQSGSATSRQGRGGSAFGASGGPAGGLPPAVPGSPSRRAGTGASQRGSGVVGEGERAFGGGSGKRAFTEGGTGLGSRGRARAEGSHAGGIQQVPGMGPVPFAADTRGRRKERGKDGKRPEYLVEDEETWVPAKPANPNVVE